MPQPYSPDYNWLWGSKVEDPIATLRVRVTASDSEGAREAVQGYFASLPADENGVHGEGGWAAYHRRDLSDDTHEVIDLVSGGEDVADGIEAAADSLYNHLKADTALGIEWEQLPLESASGS